VTLPNPPPVEPAEEPLDPTLIARASRSMWVAVVRLALVDLGGPPGLRRRRAERWFLGPRHLGFDQAADCAGLDPERAQAIALRMLEALATATSEAQRAQLVRAACTAVARAGDCREQGEAPTP